MELRRVDTAEPERSIGVAARRSMIEEDHCSSSGAIVQLGISLKKTPLGEGRAEDDVSIGV
jgi:hypothetical protein